MAHEALEQVLRYHEATKHHYHRYARSPGYLDWANQPDPFRRYEGSPLHLFPFAREERVLVTYDSLFVPGRLPPQPGNMQTVGQLFEFALGLSAWKEYQGNRWELRCNPSSGNLHPTEGYLLADSVAGLAPSPAVFHYAPREHVLEERCRIPKDVWAQLTPMLPAGAFLLGLSSIHWREAWKYGERAYRYCHLDLGHAVAALSLSAAALGWRLQVLDTLGDDDVAALLGLELPPALAPEREYPELLALVTTGIALDTSSRLQESAAGSVSTLPWQGKPNRLSVEHVEWGIIAETARAARKPATPPRPFAAEATTAMTFPERGWRATRLFLQRRSALAMDGVSGMPEEDFVRMLARTLPHAPAPPWNTGIDCANIHLAIFVHRVDGVAPGLYLLCRHPSAEEGLRAAMAEKFLWRPLHGHPQLPCFLLRSGDFRQRAAQISCQQAIAGDGAFSLGMLARFDAPLREIGPWMYPRLYWEAGMIGQVLYLEAEAAGLRATGIGCFFDDPMHELLGLKNRSYQSLYHFTVGGAVEDPRLQTLPPYSRERRELV